MVRLPVILTQVIRNLRIFYSCYRKCFSGTIGGALSLSVVTPLVRSRILGALPPDSSVAPVTVYDLFSGFGTACLGMVVYRGIYFILYDSMSSAIPTGYWTRFYSGIQLL